MALGEIDVLTHTGPSTLNPSDSKSVLAILEALEAGGWVILKQCTEVYDTTERQQIHSNPVRISR